MAAIAHQRNTDARYRAGLSSPPRSRASLLGARAVPLPRAPGARPPLERSGGTAARSGHRTPPAGGRAAGSSRRSGPRDRLTDKRLTSSLPGSALGRTVAGTGAVVSDDLGPPRRKGVAERADLLHASAAQPAMALSRRTVASAGSSVRYTSLTDSCPATNRAPRREGRRSRARPLCRERRAASGGGGGWLTASSWLVVAPGLHEVDGSLPSYASNGKGSSCGTSSP